MCTLWSVGQPWLLSVIWRWLQPISIMLLIWWIWVFIPSNLLQAGTQFWDETLERELRENRLTGASLDRCVAFRNTGNSLETRFCIHCNLPHFLFSLAPFVLYWCRYCIVLFAGIAAEGLVYGEAEGGESDENLYKGVISGLRPPWAPGKVSTYLRFCLSTS